MFKKNKKKTNKNKVSQDTDVVSKKKKFNDKKLSDRLKYIFSDDSPDSKTSLFQSVLTLVTVPVLILGIVMFAVQATRYHEYKVSHAMPNNTNLPMRFLTGDASQASSAQSMTYAKTLISPDKKDMVIYIKTGLSDTTVSNFNLPVTSKQYKVDLVTTDGTIKNTQAHMGWYGLSTIYVKLHTDKSFPQHAFAVMLLPKTYVDFKTQMAVDADDDGDFTQISQDSASSSSQGKDNSPKNPFYAVRVNANEAEKTDITSDGKLNFKKVVENTAFKDKMEQLTDNLRKARANVTSDKKRLAIAKQAMKESPDSDVAKNTFDTAKSNLEEDQNSVDTIKQNIKKNQDKLANVTNLKAWSTTIKRVNQSTSSVVH